MIFFQIVNLQLKRMGVRPSSGTNARFLCFWGRGRSFEESWVPWRFWDGEYRDPRAMNPYRWGILLSNAEHKTLLVIFLYIRRIQRHPSGHRFLEHCCIRRDDPHFSANLFLMRLGFVLFPFFPFHTEGEKLTHAFLLHCSFADPMGSG